MSLRYKWLLFDADNTLLDFDSSAEKAFYQTLTEFGLKINPDDFHIYERVNKGVWKEFEQGLISPTELRPKRFELFLHERGESGDAEAMNAHYLQELIHHSSVLPGADAMLKSLSKSHLLGLITNGLKEVQRPRLDRTGITTFFKVIVVSDEIGHAKPHREFFDHTFRELGFPDKSSVLVIGDSLSSDMRGGLDYGVDTCWFNPNGKGSHPEIQPKYTIQKLEELHSVLQS